MNINKILTALLPVVFVMLCASSAQADHDCVFSTTSIGPVDPANGYPLYYQDSGALALDLCLDAANCLNHVAGSELPDPSAAASFPGNWPSSAWWWRAEATATSASGATATLVMGLRTALDGGLPVDGKQFAEAVILVTASGLVPGGEYDFKHPFGSEEVTAASDGTVVIEDVQGFLVGPPGNLASFAGINNSRVGPFLVFDDPDPNRAPAPGFVGNPVVAHRVAGSPCGDNHFKVKGPDPVGDFLTEEFKVLGRMIDVCGNGVLDLGEQCDDGNNTDGDCCSATCMAEDPLVVCDDNNSCTDELCLAGVGCSNQPNTLACDDGSVCTTVDSCWEGNCLGSMPLDCNDSNPCTEDSCDAFAGCVNDDVSLPCDDGNPCTTADTCSAGACVGGAASDCDDADVCTDDTCDPSVGCVSTNNTAACDDGNACTAGDTCSAGACLSGPSVDCEDGNGCTDDSCDPGTGCRNDANTLACDDGDACTTADSCSAGTCVGGPAPDCDDGNQCTADSCVSPTGCESVKVSISCDDGNACTTADTCSDGLCVGGLPPDCDDGNGCTDDGCNMVTGCTSNDNSLPCDDGSACTTADTCAAGGCVGGVPPDCEDGNVCSDHSCDPASGCLQAANTAACEDGDATTLGDTCANMGCVSGAFGCSPAPLQACTSSLSVGRSVLEIKDKPGETRDKLHWKWLPGPAVSTADFGNPVSGELGYAMCIWDEDAGVPTLVSQHLVPAGGTCRGTDCWHERRHGLVYRDDFGTQASGVRNIKLRSGGDFQTKIKVNIKGAGLDMPPLPVSMDSELTVQFINEQGGCWTSTYSAPAITNKSGKFLGKSSGN